MHRRRRTTRRVEHRRRRGRRSGGIGRPHRGARHPREQLVDRAPRDLHRLVGQAPGLRRAASGGSRLGRDHERQERALLLIERRDRRFPGAGDVARPPARLGQVEQAGFVEGVAAGQRLELGPSERKRTQAQVQPREDQVRIAGRDPAGVDRAHQDGSRRCRSNPRR